MRCVCVCSCSSRLKGRTDSTGLSEYAKHCLREICSQEWVREKFLKEPDHLFTVDLLLDKMLSNRQVTKPALISVLSLYLNFVLLSQVARVRTVFDVK